MSLTFDLRDSLQVDYWKQRSDDKDCQEDNADDIDAQCKLELLLKPHIAMHQPGCCHFRCHVS